jgi:hypothetical protein
VGYLVDMRSRAATGAGVATIGLVLALLQVSDTMADDLRLQQLEARLEEVLRRLERLESQGTQGTSTTSLRSEDGVQWSFDLNLSQEPFNVTHQSFDRASGRFDLLLKVVAPIRDPKTWQVAPGAPVPVVAVLTLADGTANESVVFHLARGPKLDPGAKLHLKAEIATEQAAAVRGVSVGVRETAR